MTTSDSRACDDGAGAAPGAEGPQAAPPFLQRVTTEYIDAEDRLRLCGELPGGQAQVLWLTQRLAQRLVPHLCGWLEQQTAGGLPNDLVQEFAQQAAQANLESQARVDPQGASQSCLVQSIDVSVGEAGVTLLFKPEAQGGQAVSRLALHADSLRQWLGIVLAQYQLAQWPLDAWPHWMIEARAPIPLAAPVMH